MIDRRSPIQLHKAVVILKDDISATGLHTEDTVLSRIAHHCYRIGDMPSSQRGVAFKGTACAVIQERISDLYLAISLYTNRVIPADTSVNQTTAGSKRTWASIRDTVVIGSIPAIAQSILHIKSPSCDG
jgi:hypothetical protein